MNKILKHSIRVSLKRYLRINDRWRYASVFREQTRGGDRWRTDLIVLDGKPVKCDIGSFYLDYRQDGRRKQVASATRAGRRLMHSGQSKRS
ncbi:hypothetical protein H7849_08810 [Alloacidobacterium dinghuense]|uniref:Uncharacterized protein n=1 Tax=Alloacidobacterium dinghuense TaxID=2763107 RepID=A0A7G8BN69_9BACT|nr:hypothetical protein [Alloacidobacterium dinghuense]QNI33989.1 hypothetical protein H7849_08810 [Alloacidobacterium dinghuense]